MFKDLFRRKRSPVLGIDISPASVKVLELSASHTGYRVEGYAIEAMPADAMQDKEIKNTEGVGMAIERAVKRARTHIKEAAVALSGSSVISKVIQMNANFDENELSEQLALEAERYIPFPLQEVNMDFQILGRNAKNSDLNDVLLAATRSDSLDTIVEALSIGGLTAKVVDIEAYAIERAMGLIADQLPTMGHQQTIVVADIGANQTAFNVLHDRKTVYTREQNFGGKQLVEEIQRRYNLSYEEAMIARKQGGLPEDYQSEVLEPFEEALSQQINRSLQFFFSSTSYTEIDYLVLAGASAILPGLVERLERKVNAPTMIADPFSHMEMASRVNLGLFKEDAPALLISCGLALRSFT